jgi:sterol desaturase/sphingolipid hydroxylase (fatty acid hydroxylase superfamily)
METTTIILVSILLGSIALEVYLSLRDNLKNYNRADTKANIGIAAIGITTTLIVKTLMIGFFSQVQHHALFTIESAWWSWFVLILLSDLHAYGFHLLGHRSRIFWAMHVIHHSSLYYNLTTAIRTPFTNIMFRFLSMTPLVLLGFDFRMVLLIDTLIHIYAFYQHTEVIKKLGWLEYILSTPSHHRVHHASDIKYLDKNYGNLLILWDKLFGTFQVEDEHPTYGLTKPLNSTNIGTIIFHEWISMANDVRHARNLNEALHYIFAHPGWKPSPPVTRTKRTPMLPILKSAALIALLTILGYTVVLAQPSDQLLEAGIEAEMQHHDAQALKHYQALLKIHPDHVEALRRSSRMLSNKAGRSTARQEKALYAQQASEYASKAISLNPHDKEAYLAHIISLGMLSEVADSPSEKIRNAKIIRSEAETILIIDSAFAPAHYILGKWHFEVAKLNWAEKLACNLLFGGVPKGASIEKSL